MSADKRPTVEECLRKSPLDKSLKVVNTVNTGYLGQCKVIQDTSTTRYLLLKEMVYNGEEEFVNAVQLIQMQKAIRDEGLLYIIDYSTEKINNFCSSFFNLRVYLLPHLEELRKLSKEREKTKEGLTEKEMTYLLYHLVQGLSELHKAGFTHKQISPESVDTTNLVGRNPKLIFFEDGSNSNVKQVTYNNIFKSKDLFVAPEIFEKATTLVKTSSNAAPLNFDEQKLDAFSLGMTLLYAGCGHPIQDCYDTKTFRFNRQRLDAYIAEFKSKYAVNPMITEAVEKLLDVDVNNRTSALNLQSELPRLEEINQYFEIISEDNMQGDYNEKYPLSAEDKRAGDRARAYLISKNKLYKAPTGPVTTFNQASNAQGATGQQGFAQDGANRPGYQTAGSADLKPGQQNANLGVSGAAQAYPYGQNDASRLQQNQGASQFGSYPPIGGTFYESQLASPNASQQQQFNGLGAGQNKPAFAPFNPSNSQAGGYQMNQGGQPPMNGAYSAQAGGFGGQQTPSQGAQFGTANQANPQQSRVSNVSGAANPLMNFMYPGSAQKQTQQSGDQIALGSAQKPLASKLNASQTTASFGPSQLQAGNTSQNQATDPSKQYDASRNQTSNRPGAVLVDHNIFGRPQAPVQTQFVQPAPKPTNLVGTSLLSSMKRSASQPTRIGTHVQSEAQLTTPVTTTYAKPSLVSRPVTYSQTNLHSAYIPAQTRVSQGTYNPITSGLSSGNSRIRSSSHNIIRNGMVVDVDNPAQELRASRIVVSGDKVDYFLDDAPARRVGTTVPAPAFTSVQTPSYSSIPSPAYRTLQNQVQATPTYTTYQGPGVTTHSVGQPLYGQLIGQPVYSSTLVRDPVGYSRPAYYTSGTPVRTSNHVLGQVHQSPHHVTSYLPSTSYINGPRVYSSGTPVRYANQVPLSSSARVIPTATTSGLVYQSTATPRRVVATGTSQATPKSVQRYNLQPEIKKEELTTPRNEEAMLESKYIAEQIQPLVENNPVKVEAPANKRDDSEIKPRELDSGEGEYPRIHAEEVHEIGDKAEPNWTDN